MIGILALQGDYESHGKQVAQAGEAFQYIRKPEQLESCSGLIIPGGESTTMLKLIHLYHMWEALQGFAQVGKPIYGTCAGMILLAKTVKNPEQDSLALIDIVVERNSYGRQRESFEETGWFHSAQEKHEIPMMFIRAPRLLQLGREVQSLAFCRQECVVVQQNNILVTSFHPELTQNLTVIQYFIQMVHH